MTEDLSKNSRKRSDLVAEQIKEDIITKRLPPGERLSDEKDFLKTYRVSKGTMREALKALEVQGLVNIRTGPGGGASVSRVSAEKANELLWNYFFSRNVSIEDIYAVRKLVEPELAANVAQHLDEEDLALLEQSVGHCSIKGFESNDRAQRIQELDFHLVLADACPNPVLSFFAKFILSLLARIIIHEDMTPDPQISERHSQQGLDYHQALLQAFRARDPESARQVMIEHMEAAESFMLQNYYSPAR
ncbi:MAG: FadR/GntR family transcriptional regulator [bacterium]|jgi:GntR family transcriptional repressor for pyruvate dehydrogenase complex